MSSALCFSAVFASGFMNGGSGWSWGREPPLWAFLLCLPRVLLTPFRWVMLDTLWYPLPLCLPALGKPNQNNQCNASIISQRGSWHYVGAGCRRSLRAPATRRPRLIPDSPVVFGRAVNPGTDQQARVAGDSECARVWSWLEPTLALLPFAPTGRNHIPGTCGAWRQRCPALDLRRMFLLWPSRRDHRSRLR